MSRKMTFNDLKKMLLKMPRCELNKDITLMLSDGEAVQLVVNHGGVYPIYNTDHSRYISGSVVSDLYFEVME